MNSPTHSSSNVYLSNRIDYDRKDKVSDTSTGEHVNSNATALDQKARTEGPEEEEEETNQNPNEDKEDNKDHAVKNDPEEDDVESVESVAAIDISDLLEPNRRRLLSWREEDLEEYCDVLDFLQSAASNVDNQVTIPVPRLQQLQRLLQSLSTKEEIENSLLQP